MMEGCLWFLHTVLPKPPVDLLGSRPRETPRMLPSRPASCLSLWVSCGGGSELRGLVEIGSESTIIQLVYIYI